MQQSAATAQEGTGDGDQRVFSLRNLVKRDVPGWDDAGKQVPREWPGEGDRDVKKEGDIMTLHFFKRRFSSAIQAVESIVRISTISHAEPPSDQRWVETLQL